MTITIPPGSIDTVLRNNRQPGTTFQLMEGEYTTQGGFAFESNDLCVLAPGCFLIGAGSHLTKIKARNVDTKIGGKDAQYVELLTGGARTKGVSHAMRMEGFTLDCSEIKVPTVAIHIYSTCATVKDVVVQDVVGMRVWSGEVNEGFGILVNNAAEALADGGNSIVDCRVITRALAGVENYITAVYMGCVKRPGLLHMANHVTNVQVLAPTPAHAGFGVNDRTTITDCTSEGFIRAIFCDTDNAADVLVRNFSAWDCNWALDFRAVAEGTLRTRMVVADSRFVFKQSNTEWAQAILLEAAPNAYIEQTRLQRCTFVARGVNASKGRLRGAGVTQVYEEDCTWIGVPDHPWQDYVLQEGAEAVDDGAEPVQV
jgi:hypothetical protein